MKGKKGVFIIFGVIVLICTIIFHFDTSDKKASGLSDLSRNEKIDIHAFERFTDFLKQNIDTTIYAEYRSRPNEFVFYHLNNNQVGSPLLIEDSIEQKIIDISKSNQIRRIWKYKFENFYRFEILNDESMIGSVLVLDSGNFRIRSLELAGDEDSLIAGELKNISRYKTLKKISERVYLYVVKK